MSDFIDEMQEELKKENFFMFLKNHKWSFISLIAASILGIVVYGFYSDRKDQSLDKDFLAYQSLVNNIDSGEFKKASKAIDLLIVKKNGFGFLAGLQNARLGSRLFLSAPSKGSYEGLKKIHGYILSVEDRKDLALEAFLKASLLYQVVGTDFSSDDTSEFLEAPSPEGSPWGAVSLLGRSLHLYGKGKPIESLEILQEAEQISKGHYGENLDHFFTILEAGVSSETK